MLAEHVNLRDEDVQGGPEEGGWGQVLQRHGDRGRRPKRAAGEAVLLFRGPLKQHLCMSFYIGWTWGADRIGGTHDPYHCCSQVVK